MEVYVGYGFDADKINGKHFLKLLAARNGRLYRGCVGYAKEAYPKANASGIMDEFMSCAEAGGQGRQIDELIRANDEAANAIGAVAKDFIEVEYVSCANFLSEIINEGEKEAAGTDDVVCPIAERYLAFDNIDFAGEEKRAAHIPTCSDFIIMVGKYLPCDDIKFTPIWVDVEWEELHTE